MNGWKEHALRMAQWLEEHADAPGSLMQMARALGYSPTYCSMQFHRCTGLTLREYTMQRRLYRAAVMIRDTQARLIDIALDCGYASHEALTAAFRQCFGIPPDAYRKQRALILLPLPYVLAREGGAYMLTEPNIRVEYIPAHRYLGVYAHSEVAGEPVWPGHDCDLVTHTVQSMAHLSDVVIGPHTAGWVMDNEERRYFYGLGVPVDYAGSIPAGFELRDVPGGYYQVVSHPPFRYPEDNAEVMRRVEHQAFDKPCQVAGYRWKAAGQSYQRHYPEGHGYMVLRPIEKE